PISEQVRRGPAGAADWAPYPSPGGPTACPTSGPSRPSPTPHAPPTAPGDPSPSTTSPSSSRGLASTPRPTPSAPGRATPWWRPAACGDRPSRSTAPRSASSTATCTPTTGAAASAPSCCDVCRSVRRRSPRSDTRGCRCGSAHPAGRPAPARRGCSSRPASPPPPGSCGWRSTPRRGPTPAPRAPPSRSTGRRCGWPATRTTTPSATTAAPARCRRTSGSTGRAARPPATTSVVSSSRTARCSPTRSSAATSPTSPTSTSSGPAGAAAAGVWRAPRSSAPCGPHATPGSTSSSSRSTRPARRARTASTPRSGSGRCARSRAISATSPEGRPDPGDVEGSRRGPDRRVEGARRLRRLAEEATHGRPRGEQGQHQHRHLDEPAERDRVAEDQRDELEHDQLAAGGHQPQRPARQHLRTAGRRGVPPAQHGRLEEQHGLERDLEQDRGQQRVREALAHHRRQVLDREVEDHDVDEDVDDIGRPGRQPAPHAAPPRPLTGPRRGGRRRHRPILHLPPPARGRSRVPEAAPMLAAMPTINLLTEDALRPSDVENIATLHGDEPLTITVLVPADTERNVVTDFIDHLSLLELKEAWEAITERE